MRPGGTREAVEMRLQPIRQSELKSGGRPQSDGTEHPILGRHLGPVHRFRACWRLVIDCRNTHGIDGSRRRTIHPGWFDPVPIVRAAVRVCAIAQSVISA